jgi:predicted S18 family serine protease
MDNFIQDYLMYLSYPNDMTPKTVQKIIPRLQNEIHSLEDIAITYDIRIENLEKVVAAYTRLHGDLPQHVKDELITDLTAKL